MKIPIHFEGLKVAIQTIAVVLLCLLYVNPALSQSGESVPTEDVIYLKDGSVYKGIIVDENGSFIYMEVLDGNRIDIPRWKIRKKMSNNNFIFHNRGRYHYTKGLFGALTIGLSPTDESVFTEQVSFLVGYRFNKRFSAAIGLGNELTTSEMAGFEVETNFSSYYLYGRYYLSDYRRRPFVYARGGYGSGPADEAESGRHSGGIQGQIGAGIHFASKRRSRFVLSLGYHVQHTSGQQFFLDTFGNEVLVEYPNTWINNFVISFGIEFR